MVLKCSLIINNNDTPISYNPSHHYHTPSPVFIQAGEVVAYFFQYIISNIVIVLDNTMTKP